MTKQTFTAFGIFPCTPRARVHSPLTKPKKKKETSKLVLKKKRGGNPHSPLKEELSHRRRRHYCKPHIDIENVERAKILDIIVAVHKLHFTCFWNIGQ